MTLPSLYFRLRENGAAVFRVDTENRQGRLELEPLAIANVRNGEIRAQGGREITKAERAEIEGWIVARQTVLAAREAGLAEDTIEAINTAAHWVQGRASDADIAAHGDSILLALHDLRSQIVRRQADAVDKSGD